MGCAASTWYWNDPLPELVGVVVGLQLTQKGPLSGILHMRSHNSARGQSGPRRPTVRSHQIRWQIPEPLAVFCLPSTPLREPQQRPPQPAIDAHPWTYAGGTYFMSLGLPRLLREPPIISGS